MNNTQIITRQLILQTKFFKNVLLDINDEESKIRMNKQTNHLAWIAGHLVVIRFGLAVRFGLRRYKYPHLDLFVIKDIPPPNAKSLDENINYPHLNETLNYWDSYSEYLINKLPVLTEEQLNSELNFETPIGGKSVLESLAFSVSHEAYHIGQMSIIRKSLGHTAMDY